jgi:hypothetical protein
MKVSRNEMNAALKRAYEGAAYAIGDYEEAAELITWSEMCGLGGFADASFPPLAPQVEQLPRINYESNGIAVIDANATDVCQYGSLAAHLACTLADREGIASVHLTNCTSPKLILGSLAKIAPRGFYLSAYWQQNNSRHGASFDSASPYPDYWVSEGAGSDAPAALSSITILCTRQPGLLANTIRQLNFKPKNEFQVSSAAILASRYDAALNQGIEVDSDQWEALNKAAWPILVATSQQSSLGAGPG